MMYHPILDLILLNAIAKEALAQRNIINLSRVILTSLFRVSIIVLEKTRVQRSEQDILMRF
jgi:hypothetical protein